MLPWVAFEYNTLRSSSRGVPRCGASFRVLGTNASHLILSPAINALQLELFKDFSKQLSHALKIFS
jgi:hypothetical protein